MRLGLGLGLCTSTASPIITPDVQYGANLKQWLRSDTGTVASWTDKSGNGRDATQANGTLQPTIVAGVLNGRPVYRFASGNQMAHTLVQAVPYTVFVVMQFTGATTLCDVYGCGTGSYSVQGSVNVGHNWGVFSNAGVSSGGSVTAAFKTCTVVARTTADVDLVTSASVLNVNPGAPLGIIQSWVGKDTALGDPGAFDVAEIIVVSGAVSAGSRASTLAYLQSLYGATV